MATVMKSGYGEDDIDEYLDAQEQVMRDKLKIILDTLVMQVSSWLLICSFCWFCLFLVFFIIYLGGYL